MTHPCLDAPGYVRVDLPRSETSPRRAREFIRSWLSQVGSSDPGYRADISIVVAELVTNAVTHGADPIELHLWKQDDGVRVGVSDASRVAPTLRTRSADSDVGRGLRIVNEVARRWGTDVTEDGKLVWAEIPEPVGRTPAPSQSDAVV